MAEKRKISAITRLAIQTFLKKVRAELRVEELENELNALLLEVPKEEMTFYIQRTEAIRKMLE